ncbi:MAG: SRPBCC family protein [Phycisphaerales bacterium]|nr:SRPBCC family protein [Phycisphaerales bacterium]
MLETEVFVARPIDRVFEFFGDAGNLERITPAFLRFSIVTPRPIEMRPGTLIDYRLRLHGLPLRWRTLISAWEPPHRFVDEQIRGPYRLWRHEHTFEAAEVDGVPGTTCRDRVEYAHWGTGLGERLMVRPNLERIFAFRQRAILDVFRGVARQGSREGRGVLAPAGV